MARVLIVEDDHDMAELLVQLLACHGHETHVAHTGGSAMAELAMNAPHAAVLDIGLPQTEDGIRLAHRIREHCDGNVRLIALTGYLDSVLPRSQLLAAGFDEVLRKPVDFDALLAAVSKHPPAGTRSP